MQNAHTGSPPPPSPGAYTATHTVTLTHADAKQANDPKQITETRSTENTNLNQITMSFGKGLLWPNTKPNDKTFFLRTKSHKAKTD